VSILNRFIQSRHLDEATLAEIWSSAAAGSIERGSMTHPHLASCAHCRSRYAAFTGWLDGLREDARAEADEAFPSERLAAQQAQIFRRLEALERPARVIPFPKFSRVITSRQTGPQRWIATAAAVGLLVGLAAGQWLDLRHAFDPAVARSAESSRPSRVAPTLAGGLQPVSHTDEEFLYGDRVGASAQGISYAALQSFDDVTPRARDDFEPR
jgi:anti-sigma factor RsiW